MAHSTRSIRKPRPVPIPAAVGGEHRTRASARRRRHRKRQKTPSPHSLEDCERLVSARARDGSGVTFVTPAGSHARAGDDECLMLEYPYGLNAGEVSRRCTHGCAGIRAQRERDIGRETGHENASTVEHCRRDPCTGERIRYRCCKCNTCQVAVHRSVLNTDDGCGFARC
jgi:hypothetical protein